MESNTFMIMREITSTITSKGQSTIPAEVRRRLGVSPHDQIVFVIEGDLVSLRPAKHSFASVRGSVPAQGIETVDARKEIDIAREDVLLQKYGPQR